MALISDLSVKDGLRLINVVGGVTALPKAAISSRPERVIGHIGTETRSKLLTREAAVGNLRPMGAT